MGRKVANATWQKLMDGWGLPEPVHGKATHAVYAGETTPQPLAHPTEFDGYELGDTIDAWTPDAMVTQVRTIDGNVTFLGGSLMRSVDRAQFDAANVHQQRRAAQRKWAFGELPGIDKPM